MQWRILSVVLLGVWLGLFTADFFDDLGLIGDTDSDVEQSLDVALADLGQAIDGPSHHSHAVVLHASRSQPGPAHPGLPAKLDALHILGVAPLAAFRQSARAKPYAKIHLFHRVFLI